MKKVAPILVLFAMTLVLMFTSWMGIDAMVRHYAEELLSPVGDITVQVVPEEAESVTVFPNFGTYDLQALSQEPCYQQIDWASANENELKLNSGLFGEDVWYVNVFLPRVNDDGQPMSTNTWCDGVYSLNKAGIYDGITLCGHVDFASELGKEIVTWDEQHHALPKGVVVSFPLRRYERDTLQWRFCRWCSDFSKDANTIGKTLFMVAFVAWLGFWASIVAIRIAVTFIIKCSDYDNKCRRMM